MKSNIKKLLVIFVLIISYIIISLICGNTALAVTQTTSSDINAIDSNQYPQVKELLQSLQFEHPNWKFKILYTDIDWATAIANEYVGHGSSPRNLVPANSSSYPEAWKCSACGSKTYDNGSWACASEVAIAYIMDARNSLNSTNIFQFMELSYTECTAEALRPMVANTFLNSDSCINAILEAAKTHNVNAYYIVARILQEQGASGSTLSKGQGYNGQYVGVYNVFNIGASGNGKETVILNGLARAQSEGWTTLESSIIGGTQIIAKSYIARGQNTLYLQKFDVDNSDDELYWHQYMQNLLAAKHEGATLRETFEDMGSIDGAYTFIIPVFKNMPAVVSQNPSNINTNTPTGTDLVRVNVTGSLYLRDQPRKDANKIGSIYKDDIVTRLEKATEKVDGTYWDYVMTASGTRGYAARQTYDSESTYKLYLVPVNSVKAKVDTQTNVATVIPDGTINDLANLLQTEIVVKNANGETLNSNDRLGTGCVINDKYTVVVLGDINGDGEVLATDALQILKNSTNISNLSGAYLKAADLDNDGNVLATDALIALKYSTKSANIEIKE